MPDTESSTMFPKEEDFYIGEIYTAIFLFSKLTLIFIYSPS